MKCLYAWGEVESVVPFFQFQCQSAHGNDKQIMFLSLPLIAITNIPRKRARLKIVSIFFYCKTNMYLLSKSKMIQKIFLKSENYP